MKTIEIAKKYQDYMVRCRRHLHENPELSGQEFETVKYIDAQLTDMGIDHVVVENGGVLGFIKGAKDNGKTVLLRADCDALPVLEKDNLNGTRACWSKKDGVMHACGHDAHTAGLLGAAKVLLEKKDEIEGTVILCFERGEEYAGNSKYLFKYITENNIKVDSCFGMHTSVALSTGAIGINDENMLAGAMGFEIEIEGRGGHGSRPDQSNSPIDCFCAIYQRLESLRLTKIDPFKTCTYSVGKLQAGIQGNVIPQKVVFGGTMRTFDPEGVGMAFYDEFKKAIEGIAAAYDCKVNFIRYSKPGLATVNDPECAQWARKIFTDEIGAEFVSTTDPVMGSESYSSYLKMWPGVFAQLGCHNPEKGTGAANHNEKFDVDEDCLMYEAAYHTTYAIEFLKSDFVTTHKKKLTHKEILRYLENAEDLELLYGEKL